MNFLGRRNFLGLLLIFMAVFSFGCNSSVRQSSEPQEVVTQTEQSQPEANPLIFTEPVLPWEERKFSDGLRETWQRFTASGQYRLAQPLDMRFSDLTKEGVSRNIVTKPIPFVYIWGDLNYKKRIEDDHLAVIVVDTTKQDENRFSLVIFSPPAGKKDVYKTHWLYRDRDLSRTTANRASGEFYVAEYFDDGTRKSCSVRWNERKKQFQCG